jgi:hypothetical protein
VFLLRFAFHNPCIKRARAHPPHAASVIKTAQSAWGYTESGLNFFGEHNAVLRSVELDQFVDADGQDAGWLLLFLRRHNGPQSTFLIANTLSDALRWPRKRIAKARARLIELGYLTQVRRASPGSAALFKWSIIKDLIPPQEHRESVRKGLVVKIDHSSLLSQLAARGKSVLWVAASLAHGGSLLTVLGHMRSSSPLVAGPAQ